MVRLGSMQIRSLLSGFSLTSMLDSQSVGWITGPIMPSSQSLFNSPSTLFNFATGTRRVGAFTGETEGSNSMCMGLLRGFPRPGLIMLQNILLCQITEWRKSGKTSRDLIVYCVCFVCVDLQVSQGLCFLSNSAEEWWFATRYVNHKEVYCLQFALAVAAQGHLSLRSHGLAYVRANSARGLRNLEILK